MAYRFTIHTEKYKNMKSQANGNLEYHSLENVDNINAFIHSMNGIKYTESSLKDLKRRILFFAGLFDRVTENPEENAKWLEKWKDKNSLIYTSNHKTYLHEVSLFGCYDLFFDIEWVLKEIRKKKTISIPLNMFFDNHLRGQVNGYVDCLRSCYIEIETLS